MKRTALAGFIATAGLLSFGSLSAEAAGFFIYETTTPTGFPIDSPQSYNSTPTGGPTLTVTGFKDLATSAPGDFDINSNGLGVDGAPGGGNVGRNSDFEEAVQLTFGGVSVELSHITFGVVPNNNDEVSLFVDGDFASPISVDVSGTAPVTTEFDTPIEGSTFTLASSNDFDSFRITEVGIVPEPLTILGTGLALASMPLLKKTHKKN